MSRKNYKIYILLKEGLIIDAWTNLKKLCGEMNEKTDFASYSKLSKMSKESGTLDFRTKSGVTYQVIIKVLK